MFTKGKGNTISLTIRQKIKKISKMQKKVWFGMKDRIVNNDADRIRTFF